MNVVFNDDGKRSLLMMKDKNGIFLNYTNREHLKYTKRLKYQRKIETEKTITNHIGISIKEQETELNDYNSKTTNLTKFITYCNKKLEINAKITKEYENPIFRKYKWYGYINRTRQETKLSNRIEKTFGKEAIIISGDASVCPTMKHIISTPNKRLKRIIKNKIYQEDEFRTSCVNYKNGICYWKNNLKIKDKQNKTRSLHPVLIYQINRDKNAVYNMEIIYNHYLEYCKGNIETPRPEIYCRNVKIPKLKLSNQKSNRQATR